MNRYLALSLMVILGISLSACVSSKVSHQETVANSIDPDLVAMPGFGSEITSNSLMGVKAMTVNELTICGDKISYLKKESIQVKTDSTTIAKKRSGLIAQQQNLDQDRIKVNTRNAKQVKAFNHKVRRASEDAKEYNAEVHTHNAKVAALNLRNNDFTVTCAQRSFRRSDLALLSPALRLAIESNSTESEIPLIEEASAPDIR